MTNGKDTAYEKDQLMDVLVVEPGRTPYVKTIDPGLASLQHEVGGYIQAVYPYEETVALICDEEGKLNGKPYNRALRAEDGTVYDIVAGTFLITGLGEEDFTSLSPKLAEQFKDKFQTPEAFLQMDGKLLILPVKEETQQPTPELVPLYLNNGEYAKAHGEIDVFRASYQANVACKEAIEKAISENYRDNRLCDAGAKQVLDQFGADRTLFVLATTVRAKDWDGRFSADNKAWAKTIPALINEDANSYRNTRLVVDRSHPGLVNLFIDQTRREVSQRTAAKSKTSVLRKLKDVSDDTAEEALKPGAKRNGRPFDNVR